jgi:hypothetical protein
VTAGEAPNARLSDGLPAELTESIVSVWTQYIGSPPSSARTEIRGNVVTCVLAGAVGDYNRNVIDPPNEDAVRGGGEFTPAAYKRDAIAAVVRLTHQSVAAFLSSHDRETDVARETFILEASLNRGAPRPTGDRRGASGSLRRTPSEDRRELR